MGVAHRDSRGDTTSHLLTGHMKQFFTQKNSQVTTAIRTR